MRSTDLSHCLNGRKDETVAIDGLIEEERHHVLRIDDYLILDGRFHWRMFL